MNKSLMAREVSSFADEFTLPAAAGQQALMTTSGQDEGSGADYNQRTEQDLEPHRDKSPIGPLDIARIRREIADGTYLTDEKLDAVVEVLSDLLLNDESARPRSLAAS